MQLSKSDMNMESIDAISTLRGHSTVSKPYSSQLDSMHLMRQADKLMKVVANNSRSTVQLIETELSKAYLYRALRCNDSDNDSVYCLANVYLAVLYYTTGQYQTAIDHCTLVPRSQDHSQCSSYVVQGCLLPKIDDNIDNVLGLAVFYQYVRTAALHREQKTHEVRVFTTELFAHQVLIRCLSEVACHHFTQTLPLKELERSYKRTVIEKQGLHIGDLFLLKSASVSSKQFQYKSLVYQRQQPNPTEFNTSELVQLLQQSAVEHMATYRQFQAREFGSVATIMTTDFETMYAYKRGDYERCLLLCTQNVHMLLYAVHMPDVHMFPEFIQLLDDDIASLTALTLIVNPNYKDHDNIGISQLTLLLYLMTRCQLKLRHSAAQLCRTFYYLHDAQRRNPAYATLAHLTLKLTKLKAAMYLKSASKRKPFAL